MMQLFPEIPTMEIKQVIFPIHEFRDSCDGNRT